MYSASAYRIYREFKGLKLKFSDISLFVCYSLDFLLACRTRQSTSVYPGFFICLLLLRSSQIDTELYLLDFLLTFHTRQLTSVYQGFKRPSTNRQSAKRPCAAFCFNGSGQRFPLL